MEYTQISHLDGFLGSIDTETGSDERGFFARALGREVVGRPNVEQAVNDLNQVLEEAILKGEIVPDMG